MVKTANLLLVLLAVLMISFVWAIACGKTELWITLGIAGGLLFVVWFIITSIYLTKGEN